MKFVFWGHQSCFGGGKAGLMSEKNKIQPKSCPPSPGERGRIEVRKISFEAPILLGDRVTFSLCWGPCYLCDFLCWRPCYLFDFMDAFFSVLRTCQPRASPPNSTCAREAPSPQRPGEHLPAGGCIPAPAAVPSPGQAAAALRGVTPPPAPAALGRSCAR